MDSKPATIVLKNAAFTAILGGRHNAPNQDSREANSR